MNVSSYGLSQNYYQINNQQNYIDKNAKVSLEVDEEKSKELEKEQEKLNEKINKNSQKDKSEEKSKPKTANELDPAEKKLVQELQSRDAEVRAHEAAHLAAAGGLAAGGASYTYQQGPDGKQYAIGGEVPIHIASGSTPEQTIANMQKVKAAASAPVDPSGQDMKIASTAAMMEMKARADLVKERKEESEALQEKQKEQTQKTNPYEKELKSLDAINNQDQNYKAFDMSA